MPSAKRRITTTPKTFKVRPLQRIRQIRTLQDRTAPMSDLEFAEQRIESLVRSLSSEIQTIKNPLLKDKWDYALSEVAKNGDLSKMLELTQYRREPVPIDEFLFSKTYLSLDPKEVFPGVLEALHELDGDKYDQAIFKGAIGGGKSTVANIGIPRTIYKLSCMRNPQQTFGVTARSSLVFTIQSVRLSTAKKAVFDEMGKYINDSPYFNEIYPYNKQIQSRMEFPQQNITILPVGSGGSAAISMNVIGGILDEMNFMEKVAKSKNNNADDEGGYDQAKTLYENLSRRRRSRFLTTRGLPGILYLISSSRYPDDFTELKAREAEMEGGHDPKIYVWSKSLWESKGRDRYSKETFRVLLGDDRTKSRILDAGELLPEGYDADLVLEVPETFRPDFEKPGGLNDAIRDFGGKTTLASKPFIQDREALFDCMTLADRFGYESVIDMESIDFQVGKAPTPIESRIRTDVKQMRVAHADLAVTRDSAGLAIGHVAGTRTIERRNADTGEISTEVLPIIAYDLILRIMPPRNGEIDFSMIRQIIYDLRDKYGLPIKVVTTDGFQSVDFRQILAKKGFQTEYLSTVRTTEPYKTFRDALYERRIILPRHNYLIKELTELEYKRKGSKEMVDHKNNGSNDVADACCSVASFLLTRRSAWTQQPMFMGGDNILLHGNRSGIGVTLEKLEDKVADKIYVAGRRSIQTRKIADRKSLKRAS